MRYIAISYSCSNHFGLHIRIFLLLSLLYITSSFHSIIILISITTFIIIIINTTNTITIISGCHCTGKLRYCNIMIPVVRTHENSLSGRRGAICPSGRTLTGISQSFVNSLRAKWWLTSHPDLKLRY